MSASAVAKKSIADELRELGVKGNILVPMAERGQLLDLKCDMPQCYHHEGRGTFDPARTPDNKWAPSRDHYPILKSAGGKLDPENVRLSHTWCNQRDYRLAVADPDAARERQVPRRDRRDPDRKSVLPAHGTNRWTAAMVRKAYVS